MFSDVGFIFFDENCWLDLKLENFELRGRKVWGLADEILNFLNKKI